MAKGGSWSKHPKQGQAPRKSLSKKVIAELTAEFNAKQSYLKSILPEVTPYEYYRDMFPEGSFEQEGILDGTRRPNGLASVLEDPTQAGRKYNRIVFDDLSMIEELNARAEFVIIPPVGYSGRRRLSKFAYCFYGMVIDLDDVGIDNIKDLLYQMQNKLLPQATYIINSGTGLHVVYLYDEPIPAMPQYFDSMGRLKEALSDMIWNQYTSRSKNKQYQGIFQGYRVVGSQTKISEECRVTAFKSGKKVSLHYLNEFVDEENQCTFNDLTYTSLGEAKEQWNEWYQRRIVENRPVGDYKLTEHEKIRRRSWYEAWKQRVKKGAFDGNRYYCMCVLFNYAMKAEIEIEEALEDALDLIPSLNELTTKENNVFTEDDVYAAMIYYDRKYIKMGRAGIKKMTRIDIGETKRNHRKRQDHLQSEYLINKNTGRRMNNPCKQNRELVLEDMRANGEITGRPDKESIVREWREKNPTGKKADCIKETGLSKPTVYKWWEETPGPKISKKVFKPVRKSKINYTVKHELLEMLMSMNDQEVDEFYKMIDDDSKKKLLKNRREMTPEEAAEYDRMIKYAKQMVLEEMIEGFKL